MKESIRVLPGIGEQRQKQYARLGIETVGELLYHFPRAYQNRSQIKLLSQVQDEEICPVLVTVATAPKIAQLKNRMSLLKFRVFDDSASATVVFFQQSYLKEVFRPGMTFRMYGKCRVRMGAIELSSPQFEPLLPGDRLPDYIPVYRLTEGLSGKMVAAAVSSALSRIASEPPVDPLPSSVRAKRGLPSLPEALRLIHRPRTEEDVRLARERFVFESLYLFSLGVALGKSARESALPPPLAPADPAPFLASLPFALTPDQARCVEDIARDMAPDATRPMARLVSGDVGSGKTVVAATALYLCAKGGRQALLMVPTEILANQHYAELAPLFEAQGIPCALLTGSMRAPAKRAVRQRLASGEVMVVIGTHALLSEGVSPASLGLVVTDEQHRFGVAQRARLTGGKDPHVLVMSATPIPRTLALILYGDLDASAIETLPPGRQTVDTFVVNESYRQRLCAFIKRQVQEGGQVYVVCPAIDPPVKDEEEMENGVFLDFFSLAEQSEKRPLHTCIEHAKWLSEVLDGISVGCLHGKMKSDEKNAVMQAFVSGEISVLVATTVIEVGVNLQSASLMIVEDADRFGLAQLHQLRGRVGRGTRKSYCVLVSDAEGEAAVKRLSVLRREHSGYAIAAEDLKLRGPGDFFPSSEGDARQSGQLSLGLASLCTDMDQLKGAAECARQTLLADPSLSAPENRAAIELVQARYELARQGIS